MMTQGDGSNRTVPLCHLHKGADQQMDYSNDVLRNEERAIMRLRTLYRQYGYSEYRLSRFEEYGLYAENKAFLASGDIVTFTGAGGKLMALRPDVTLSIVKNTKDDGNLKKLYYNENVYRPDAHEFKEQMQVGLECIGDIDVSLMGEVLVLAQRSLSALGEKTRVDVSHMGFISGLLQSTGLTQEQRTALLKCLGEKNTSAITELCAFYGVNEELCGKLVRLTALHGTFGEVTAELAGISVNDETDDALRELTELHKALRQHGGQDIYLDFSIVNDLSYYSGVIFQGYIEGIPAKILSGGRYDKLLRKFGKCSGAIGFAVYLDMLERLNPTEKVISIALPKGRIGEKAYAIFESAGYGCPEIFEDSRRLVFENPDSGVRFFWVKPSDVPIYVQRGAADIGVAGKDILLEHSPDVYELMDLGIGKCRICVAAVKGTGAGNRDGTLADAADNDSSAHTSNNQDRTLRVATKFSYIARDYYAKQGRDIDIIQLNGSIELAPLLGLSDVIVDIVETGKTLLENDLEVIETIGGVSARLISNKASYKFNNDAISKLCGKIAAQVT